MPFISFYYKNHRGEIALRKVDIDSFEFLVDPGFGYQPGWFISGVDRDKDVRRSFAIVNIQLTDDDKNKSGWKFPF